MPPTKSVACISISPAADAVDAFNLQRVLEQLKDLDNERKNAPKKVSFMSNDTAGYKLWIDWYNRIGSTTAYEKRRKP